MTHKISPIEAQTLIPEIIEKRDLNDTIVVEENGQPLAALISADDYVFLVEARRREATMYMTASVGTASGVCVATVDGSRRWGQAEPARVRLREDDRFLHTRTTLLHTIQTLMGGTVAEEIALGEASDGATSDLQRATQIARRMVTEFGMSDKLGPLSFGKRDELVFLGREIGEQKNYSEKVAEAIDEEIRHLIDEAYETAIRILKDKRGVLDHLAEELVRLETLEGEALEAVFNGTAARGEPSPPSPPIENVTDAQPADRGGTVPAPRLNPSPATGS